MTSTFVIASAAKQSSQTLEIGGLPRRCAPRNDGAFSKAEPA
jgi:hypothetical protein